MINYILEAIEEVKGVDEVFVISNEKFLKQFEDWQKDQKFSFKLKIVSNDSEQPRGSLGDIEYAINKAKIDDDLLIIAGDNLFDFSLKKFKEYFDKKESSILALHDYKDKNLIAHRLGCAQVDNDEKLVNFEEKPAVPKSTLAATACYLIKKEDLKLVEGVIDKRNCGNFIKELVQKSSVYGFTFDGRWFDIGTLDQYNYLKNNY
jgi:glucose-1-phosphate thymidylyltransferase